MPRRRQRRGKGKPSLIVWQWNCRGIKTKLVSLKTLINVSHNQPDLIILQEAHLIPSIPGYEPHYNISANNRPIVVTLIKKHIACTILEDQSKKHEHLETLSLKIKPHPMTKKEVVVTNIYHRPNKPIPEVSKLFPRQSR